MLTPSEKIEHLKAIWIKLVSQAQPGLNDRYVQTVCEEVVRRAEALCIMSNLSFMKVAPFLLERTKQWVLGGVAVNQIGVRLPKTLDDLGMMMIAEGGVGGKPLTGKELKTANKQGAKKRITLH